MLDLLEAAIINSILHTREVGVAFHFAKQDSLSKGLSEFLRVPLLVNRKAQMNVNMVLLASGYL